MWLGLFSLDNDTNNNIKATKISTSVDPKSKFSSGAV